MMIRKQDAVRGRASIAAVSLGAAVVLSLAGCGSDSTTPSTPGTPVPTATPAPTPTPSAVTCNPTPPAIYGIRIAIVDAATYRKTLKATPLVANYDGYCGKVGFDPNQMYCTTRTDTDPARAACDAVAVGRAGDTGRMRADLVLGTARPARRPATSRAARTTRPTSSWPTRRGSGSTRPARRPTSLTSRTEAPVAASSSIP